MLRLVPVVPAASIFFRWRAMGAVGTRPSLRPHDFRGRDDQHSSGARRAARLRGLV